MGATSLLLTGMVIYQLVLGLFGFGRKTKDYQDHEPESRFLDGVEKPVEWGEESWIT